MGLCSLSLNQGTTVWGLVSPFNGGGQSITPPHIMQAMTIAGTNVVSIYAHSYPDSIYLGGVYGPSGVMLRANTSSGLVFRTATNSGWTWAADGGTSGIGTGGVKGAIAYADQAGRATLSQRKQRGATLKAAGQIGRAHV